MSAIAPTMTGCSLLHANGRGQGSLKTYLCTFSVPAYSGSGDTITIAAVGATIADKVKNGKTNTLVGAICVEPGFDTAAQAVYLTGTSVWAMAISADTLTGQLGTSTIGGEITTSTAAVGCALAITVSEA